MNNKALKVFLDAVFYLIVFALLQFIATILFTALLKGQSEGNVMLWGSIVSSILTIALFVWRRWYPFNNAFLRTRPWAILFWVAILALGTIIPSEWFSEQLGVELPDNYEAIFDQMMSHPLGFFAICILVPVAEEIVFRGAILRVLLDFFGKKMHWIAILISALVFGAAHMNLAQFLHATLLGLLLGWLYYRTGSIFPGIVLHWVNNTVAYVVSKLMPGMNDMNLLDLCGGDVKKELFYVACSLCLFLPALFQLATRMKKPKDEDLA